MDRRGWERVTAALDQAGIAANVHPEPQDGQDLPGITIETNPPVSPERVINALGEMVTTTGAMRIGGGSDSNPKLDLRVGWPGSLTFLDTNVTP